MENCVGFLDNILVLGQTFEEHLLNLEDVFKRFRQRGLKLKPKKCIFFQREIEFLGRIVNENSLAMSNPDIKVVLEWPIPTCSKDVERYMGLTNYHRGFIKNFSKFAEPLYRVVGKQKFKWDKEQQEAFDSLKNALTTPPVLALPNKTDPFILDTDASDLAIGAELIQVQGGEEKVVAYGSFALTKEQKRYCVTRKELLAVVRFTRQFRHYLLCKTFTVRTDHASLMWLSRFKEPQGQLARWLEELSQYCMILEHRAGNKHGNADALSRIPVHWEALQSCVIPGNLPCGGCAYCERAHTKYYELVDQDWASFVDVVDDVIPLAKGVSGDSMGTSKISNADGDQSSRECVRKLRIVENISGESMIVDNEGSGEDAKGESDKSAAVHDEKVIRDLLVTQYCEDSCVKKECVINTGLELLWDPGGIEYLNGVQITLGPTQTEPVSFEIRQVDEEPPDIPEPVAGPGTSWGFTLQNLVDAQARESEFQFILEWLTNRAIPGEADLFRASPATKYYWLNKERFVMIDGVIYLMDKVTEDKMLLLPREMRELALQWHHSIPSAGHQGIKRTKEKLKEKYAWYGIGRDVISFVSGCENCNRNKKNILPGRCPMTEYQAGAPMERVHIDFLGPLTKTSKGNEHILMIVDQFTKWVECIPLPNQTAEVTARAIADNFFARFGVPFQIFSDQGRNFESKLFTELCKVLEIHKARTTPYRPSSNGQVERYNRTLMNAVRCFATKHQNQWDVHLPQIAGALRSSVNRQTGYTPNKLMLGREVNTPAQLMFPHKTKEFDDLDKYVCEFVENVQQAHERARTSLKTSTKRMKRNYDLRILERDYAVGDAVYLLDTAGIKGKCRKLCPPWKGPGVVVSKMSSYILRIRFRNSVFIVNHDRLKPCRDRVLPQWIVKWKEDPPDLPTSTDEKVYCFCRRSWQGRFMICCDYCDEWYHGSCVNVTPSDPVVVGKYKCEDCRGRNVR